jgi:hypothetical protein
MLHAAHVGHWRVVETAGRWRVLQAAFLTTAAAALYGRSLVTYGLPLLILPLVTTLTLTGGISVISEADGIPSFVRRHWHILIQFVPRKYVNPRADVYGQDCAASFNVRCPAEQSSVYVCVRARWVLPTSVPSRIVFGGEKGRAHCGRLHAQAAVLNGCCDCLLLRRCWCCSTPARALCTSWVTRWCWGCCQSPPCTTSSSARC